MWEYSAYTPCSFVENRKGSKIHGSDVVAISSWAASTRWTRVEPALGRENINIGRISLNFSLTRLALNICTYFKQKAPEKSLACP
jgi:hypothetical protein